MRVVLVPLLLACVSAASNTYYDLIQKALFISDEELEMFLSKRESFPEQNGAQSFLVCFPLFIANQAAEALKRELIGAHTIYTSKSNDAACFLVYDEEQAVSRVANNFRSLLSIPMPTASKISRSFFKRQSSKQDSLILSDAFHFFEGTGDGEIGVPLDATKHETRFEEAHRAVDSLVITFALGADVPSGDQKVRQWLKDRIHPLGVGKVNHELWFSDRISSMNDKHICDFSKLSFSYDNHEKINQHQQKYSMKSNIGNGPRAGVAHLSGFEPIYSPNNEFCLLHLLASLASEPSIINIAPKSVHTTKNYRVAQLVQAGSNSGSISSTSTPIWDFGLNGTGQIVGIADSGMDTESCFFSDAPTSSFSGFSPSSAPTVDLSESKVVQYVKYEGYGDYADEFKGHGTHVSGTALGYMGNGWPASPVTDTCADDYDNISQCLIPDFYTGCSDTLGWCGSKYSNGGDYEGGCANTCQCKNGYITQTNEQDCSELISNSNGVAFGAKVSFYDMGNSDGDLYTPNDLETALFPIAYAIGARIHTNSWGAVATYVYVADDLAVDSYLYDNPDMLILFAAGNDGADGSATVGSPAQAKSALSVGASETGRWRTSPIGNYNTEYVADFSSQGPAEDGRIKPEVVAPGYYTVSAMGVGYGGGATCSIHYEVGTSMATPATAGAAALVREYLSGSVADGAAANQSVYAQHLEALGDQLNTQYGECVPDYPCHKGVPSPSGALVKAILIHSTTAMTDWDNDDNDNTIALTGPPDNSQGFGRIDLEKVLLGPDDYPGPTTGYTGRGEKIGVWFENSGSITSSSTVSYRYRVVSTTEPLKATLVWYDPPNSVSASVQLLHDLDLTVTDLTTDTTYYSNGNSAASDELNPTEKVWLEEPPTEGGDYLINVTSSVLTEAASQSYSLVISGAGYYIADGYRWDDIYSTPSPTVTPAPSLSQEPTTAPPTTLVEDDDDEKLILGILPNTPFYLIGALLVICTVCGCLYSLCGMCYSCCCKKKEKEDRQPSNVEMVMIKVPKGVKGGDKIRAPGKKGRTVTIPKGAKSGAFVKLPINETNRR